MNFFPSVSVISREHLYIVLNDWMIAVHYSFEELLIF